MMSKQYNTQTLQQEGQLIYDTLMECSLDTDITSVYADQLIQVRIGGNITNGFP